MIKASAIFLIVIAVTWFTLSPLALDGWTQNAVSEPISRTYYYFDYACVTYSENSSNGYFDAPVNYSDTEVNQTVHVLYVGGAAQFSGNSTNPYQMRMGNGTCGYIVLKINLTYRNITGILYNISANPYIFKGEYPEIPAAVLEKYVKKPAKAVNTTVRHAFEKWLIHLGYVPSQVSKAFIALSAAQFIYGQHFIKYSASALPRSLDDVVGNKTGDCDDMSRILLNLLWGYGIPAKMEYAYVYLPYNDTFNVEGSYITFVNAGPHAYVLTYLPRVGWVSLDFLAGALIYNPSLITGESLQANITRSEVVETVKELKQYRYAEVIMAYSASSLPAELRTLLNNEAALRNYLHSLITPYLEKIKANLSLRNNTVTQPESNVTAAQGKHSTAGNLPPNPSPFTPKAMLIASSLALLATTATLLISARKGVGQ
ncbi:MAG: transglutaminase family protein [Desulfurococcales archaeon]|nr:transglutaminase family protein [Desulfurococcales archaeon]